MIAISAVGARAQMPGAGGPAGMNAAMAKLFGDLKAFSAKAEVQVLDGSQKEIATMPMDFSLLDGKIRVEMDMTQAKIASMPPGAATQLKQMGMAQVVSIVRPDKKQIFVVYPEQKAVMTMPLGADAATEKETKLDKTELGKETIDGHSCVKNKVVIDDGKGQKVEATTWEATDLKKFPIRIQTKDRENSSILNFKNVQFAKPEASSFDPPAGYTQYNSPQELMQSIMSKMTQGGAEKK
jgi:hypothetical protein